MIPIIEFGIGFAVYVFFCIITFETYSQKKEMTKAPILFFIYLYYSILAVYVINLVEQNEMFFVRFMQFLFYIIPAGLILLNYYKSNIKKKDEDMFGQNV